MKPAKKGTQKSPKSTTATGTKATGLDLPSNSDTAKSHVTIAEALTRLDASMLWRDANRIGTSRVGREFSGSTVIAFTK